MRGNENSPWTPMVFHSPAPKLASPPASIFRWHLAGAFCLGNTLAIVTLLPFLARERFGATNWQTTILTAAVPVTQLSSIFWNQLYARIRPRSYLLIVALVGCGSLALLGAANTIWMIMPLYVVAALTGVTSGGSGTAAMSPVNADMLRGCYAAGLRGRAFGLLCVAQFLATMLAGQAIGFWSDRDPNAYRAYFPLLAVLSFVGLATYRRICSQPAFDRPDRSVHVPEVSLGAPLRDMFRILREDRRFAGYEAAFMSYGIGWMICTALLPAIGTDRLHLSHSQFAHATVVAFWAALIVMLAPMGRLADRWGAAKLASVSFVWLTIYPLGLLYAKDAFGLGVFSVLYALGMAGVQLTWTLGPVALAPDPSRAAHYLAIHATMVGVRGVVAQGVGMALYSLTGSFAIPLLIAAAGFLWAAWRMRRLTGEFQRPGRA